MNRRALLSTVPIALTSATAGCMANLTDSDPGGIRIGAIAIRSALDEPQTVNLRLERNGDIVLWDSFEVGEDDIRVISDEWSTEPAQYRLLVSALDYIDMFEYDGDDARYGCDHIVVDLFEDEPSDVEVSIIGLENPPWGGC